MDARPESSGQRYEVLRTLGEGGFGQTSVARDLETGELVAIKRLQMRRAADWKVVELFEREARVLRHLDHPSIPRYLDWFEEGDDGSYCLVQALAPGENLASRVEDGWRPGEEEVRKLATSLLDVMVYLHERNPPVVHRDIKPHNVLLADDGMVSLVDFGSVKDVHTGSTGGSTVVGSFGYMAPEQFRGHAVPQTDLYGLGATLLHVLTHQDPSDMPTRRLKVDVKAVLPGLDASLVTWLERVMEPDYHDRFASAREARDALVRGVSRPKTEKAPEPSPVREESGASEGEGEELHPRIRLEGRELREASQPRSWMLSGLGLVVAVGSVFMSMNLVGGVLGVLFIIPFFTSLIMFLVGVSPRETREGVLVSTISNHFGFLKTGFLGTLLSMAFMFSSPNALTLLVGGASMLVWMLVFFLFLGYWRAYKGQEAFEEATSLELPMVSSVEPTVGVQVRAYERGEHLFLMSRHQLGPHIPWMLGGFWTLGVMLMFAMMGAIPSWEMLWAGNGWLGQVAIGLGILTALVHNGGRSEMEVTRDGELRAVVETQHLTIPTSEILSCRVRVVDKYEGSDLRMIKVLVRHREESGAVVESLVYEVSEGSKLMAHALAHTIDAMMRDVLGSREHTDEEVVFDWSSVLTEDQDEVTLSFQVQAFEETSVW